MDQTNIISAAYRLLQPTDDPSHKTQSTDLCCEICGSHNTRLVSGGKYRCLMCGFLPS